MGSRRARTRKGQRLFPDGHLILAQKRKRQHVEQGAERVARTSGEVRDEGLLQRPAVQGCEDPVTGCSPPVDSPSSAFQPFGSRKRRHLIHGTKWGQVCVSVPLLLLSRLLALGLDRLAGTLGFYGTARKPRSGRSSGTDSPRYRCRALLQGSRYLGIHRARTNQRRHAAQIESHR